ncbi:MAG: hypothetical protein M1829_004513 [Trizodia sp. TS-e1964]|nr:MAG: hypothetical protein M1829_004513 [Trizodia sp. TS-e1964]
MNTPMGKQPLGRNASPPSSSLVGTRSSNMTRHVTPGSLSTPITENPALSHERGEYPGPNRFKESYVASPFGPMLKTTGPSAAIYGTSPFVYSQILHDPFVQNGQGLSPVAMAFAPGSAEQTEPARSSGSTHGVQLPGNYTGQQTSLPARLDPRATKASLDRYLESVIETHGAEQSASAEQGSRLPVVGVTEGVNFTSDTEISRSFSIGQLSPETAVQELSTNFSTRLFQTRKPLVLDELTLTNTAYLAFSDLREAIKAFARAKELYPNSEVTYIDPGIFNQKSRLEFLNGQTHHEGKVLVQLILSGEVTHVDFYTLEKKIDEMLLEFGDIVASHRVDQDGINIFPHNLNTRVVEYFNTEAAKDAVAALREKELSGSFAGWELYLRFYNGEINYFEPRTRDKRLDAQGMNGMSRMGPNDACFRPYQKLSPTGRTSIPIDMPVWKPGYGDYSFNPDYYQPHKWRGHGAIGQERGFSQRQADFAPMPGYPDLRHEFWNGGQPQGSNHNVVDLERIRRGLDVRTTVMLRNIPNKITQTMLKEIIDERNFAQYDFMYLRIDFANNCNVGYAFINFIDPIYIIGFVESRAGRRWNRFNSDKIAEVSYATIQGRDCLIQKFRNSSVLLENPSFRPKIFYTEGPLTGQEEEFPSPDNLSKMRRSIANAEHVGLYAPRASQHIRDDHRRRRGAFDRGTSASQLQHNAQQVIDTYGANTVAGRLAQQAFNAGAISNLRQSF